MVRVKEKLANTQDCLHSHREEVEESLNLHREDVTELWGVVRSQGRIMKEMQKKIEAQDEAIAKAVRFAEEVCNLLVSLVSKFSPDRAKGSAMSAHARGRFRVQSFRGGRQ